MRKQITAIALSIALAGCQTTGTGDSKQQRDQDDQAYLSDSGSKRAAEALGLEFDPTPAPSEEWVPLLNEIELSYDTSYSGHPLRMRLSNGAHLDRDDWELYLKGLAQSMQPAARQPFLDGITRHASKYDPVEQRVVFPTIKTRPGPYAGKNHIGMGGLIYDARTVSPFIALQYYGDDWIFADRIVIRADDELIRLNDIDFSRNNEGADVLEVAYLSLSEPQYRSAVEKILNADFVIVRLTGNSSADFQVTDRMKEDMTALWTWIDGYTYMRD